MFHRRVPLFLGFVPSVCSRQGRVVWKQPELLTQVLRVVLPGSSGGPGAGDLRDAHGGGNTALFLSCRAGVGAQGRSNLLNGGDDFFNKASALPFSQGGCLVFLLQPTHLLPAFLHLLSPSLSPSSSHLLFFSPARLFVSGSTGCGCHRTSSCASGLCTLTGHREHTYVRSLSVSSYWF